MKPNFAEGIRTVSVLVPQDIVATATSTEYVKMASIGSGQLELAIQFGAITATDSTGSVTVTVAGSAAGGTDAGTAVAFNYRLTGAVATDSLGAITAATTAGVSVPSTDGNQILLAYVDPAAAQYAYVKAVLTPVDSPTATLVAATARFIPRFGQNSPKSSS